MYNFKLFEKLLAKKYFTSSFLHHSSAQPGHAYNIPEKSIEKNIKIKRLEIMASSKEADWEKLARSIEKRLSGVCEVSIVNRNTEESMRVCKLLTN
ncbi:MAG: hypothetical protein HYX60_05350 [Legionella longbeachae]|nr:hypothetical protein [Legionella longbeachae]